MGQRRAIGYVRVSKAREDMISPELQHAAIADWCVRNDVALIDTITDLDATGRNFARAGIQRVVERVVAGEADVVVVWKWSRFGRNVRDCLINIDRLEVAGGRLVAATEDFDDSPVGRFGRGQFLLMAEFESARIGQQWKEAQARRIRQGLPNTGRSRYGYRYDPNSKTYEPDPVTGPIVADCYRRYVGGESFSAIAASLNESGVPSAEGRTWHASRLQRLMDRGFAAGYVWYGGQHHAGSHEPLIDDALWRAYARTRRRRARMAARTITPTHPYSGLLRCRACGGALTRDKVTETAAPDGRTVYPRFVCVRRSDKSTPACPAPTSISVRVVDDIVARWLTGVSGEVSAAADVRKQARTGRTQARRDAARLAREVTRLEEALTRLSRQVAEGVIPVEAFTPTRDAILADLAVATRAAEAAAEAETALAAPEALPRVAADLSRDWASLDVLGRREILAALVRRITVRPPGVEDGLPRVDIEAVWEPPRP